ncbi:MAG TPA: hypothetical protein VIH90_03790 [Candidatus Saccharimonadales bacterium]
MATEEGPNTDGFVIPVKIPGQRHEGTFMEVYQEIFGVSDEALAVAAIRVAEKMKRIDENERQAAILGRSIFIR